MKRLVDLVNRGPKDAFFTPMDAGATVFHRSTERYHNVVPEIREIGFKGAATWGGRITIPLTRQDSGDLLQWLAVRLVPGSIYGAAVDNRLRAGWTVADISGSWRYADSLGTVAIALVEFEIGDALVETWTGEWMDVWSRTWIDAGRAGVWDTDIYGLNGSGNGVYCWLPLALLRRVATAFPLISVTEQEIRVHVTFRPYADVVRMVDRDRTTPCEVPTSVTLLDPSGASVTFPVSGTPAITLKILAGVTITEDPLRAGYIRSPLEIMYEPVSYARFDMPLSASVAGDLWTAQFPLTFNGPLREIAFFLRRKDVWKRATWTDYSRTGSAEVDSENSILVSGRLWVDNAVWRNDPDEWWRIEYGNSHRGGVRLAAGFVYGIVFGGYLGAEELQPSATVNASRAKLRLDLVMRGATDGWDLHVFGIGLNWMRFGSGMAVPLFKD